MVKAEVGRFINFNITVNDCSMCIYIEKILDFLSEVDSFVLDDGTTSTTASITTTAATAAHKEPSNQEDSS